MYYLQERKYQADKERLNRQNQIALIGQVASRLGGGKATAQDFGFVDMGYSKSNEQKLSEIKKQHLLKLARQRYERHKAKQEALKNGN